MSRVVALIPARDEAAHVGDAVRALRGIVEEVVVIDDGSRDATVGEALGAGATVLRTRGPVGKGGAVDGALERLVPADVWLLADADLGTTAAGLGMLIERVRGGGIDLAIAVLPPQPGGGFGIVKRWAARAIERMCGFEAREPLSGQRAVTASCLEEVRPLAAGFGLETAMTIDAVRKGFTVVEVPVAGLRHRPTGRGPVGFAHRARQGWDIGRALLRRVGSRR